MPTRGVLPKPYQKPHPPLYLACTQTDSFDVAADKGIGVLSSATYATTILAEHVKRYRARVRQATPVGAVVNEYWGNNVHAFCGEDNKEARELAALSLKTFFGPDKPYIRDRVNAYEELLESWGGVPDHLKADFGRWLRQSDDAHQAQAAQVGISLDSGPGAARAAFGQMDPDTLCERGIIIAGDPESCIKGVQLYEEAGVDQVILIMQTETIPHERALSVDRDVRQARDPGVPHGDASEARAGGGEVVLRNLAGGRQLRSSRERRALARTPRAGARHAVREHAPPGPRRPRRDRSRRSGTPHPGEGRAGSGASRPHSPRGRSGR